MLLSRTTLRRSGSLSLSLPFCHSECQVNSSWVAASYQKHERTRIHTPPGAMMQALHNDW
jgi:hypothetical protein